MWKDTADLIKVTIIQDEYANEVETETIRTVFCNVESVGRNEFYNALKAGLKPTITVTIRSYEYEEEKYLICRGKRYKIERVYDKGGENIELTCSEVAI